MRIHHREMQVTQARIDLAVAISGVIHKHDLTMAEALRVVSAEAAGWIANYARLAIRQERHGNTDDAGGLE